MREESSVYYGKEPFDLRLTVLRMIRSLPTILGITLLGTLLFGGGYYIKNVLLNRDATYTAESTYRVSFVDEPSKAGDYYINEMTWNTYVTSVEFLDAVWEHLQEAAIANDSVYVSSAEELSGMLEAKLASDIHVPSTIVTTASKEWTLLIAKAVEETMAADFVESNEQVAAIQVIDPALDAEETVPDVRPVRAFILSGILSFFFGMVVFLLRELGDSSVWLPSTLRRRYGLAIAGTINSAEIKANLEHLLAEQTQIGVCAVNDEVNPTEVIAALREKFTGDSGKEQRVREWIPIPAPMLCPEACEAMRKTEGILLVVKAGKRAVKRLEYDLEYLKTQDIRVSAVLLWDADEWLIRTYYMLGR